MEFLTNLTPIQRLGGAGILVLLLVLLLVKQRQAKAGTSTKEPKAAKAPKVKAGKSSKAKTAKASSKSSRSLSLGRKKKGEVAEPVAETKAVAGRMVPRLPAAHDGGEFAGLEAPTSEFDATAEPALAELDAPAVPTPGGMISEPGWPTPGEVWAAPGAPEVEQDADDAESWATTDHEDDALAALTTDSGSEPNWAGDAADFDATSGWETPVAADEAVEEEPSWATPAADDFDWSTPAATDDWASNDDAEAVEAEVADAEPVAEDTNSWDSGDSWTTPETTWEPVADATDVDDAVEIDTAPSAVAVADDDEVAPAIVWDPVDEVEATEEEPAFEFESAADEVVEVEAVEVVAEAPEVEVVAEAPEVEAVEVVAEVPEVVDEVVETPAFDIAAIPVEATMPQIDVVVEEPAVEVELAVAAVEVDDARADEFIEQVAAFNPADRWATMAPGGMSAPSADPVSSWARLRPTAPAVVVEGGVATLERPATPVVEASPGMAWWDVPAAMESDPRRGRFALGGYALQAGHQVVSGVTFRDGVVPPPTHWVIGPVVGAVAPGTLVLNVDGCLNCRPEDLAVLMDAGFAPTTDGFSLRLEAAAQGPFAASGTYVIS